MPRAQSDSSGGQPSQLLKRNQACHQCRRRKLRCDAQKPCSTCVRSHRFASSSNPALLHTEPDCTYDDVASAPTAAKPRAKYKVLEDKISQLENLLKQQLLKEGEASSSSPVPPTPEPTPSDAFVDKSIEYEMFDPADIMDPYSSLSEEQLTAMSNDQTTSSPSDGSRQELIMSGWSKRFPKPDLLYHLIDVFFSCYPHAHYIIHRPTFMLSLTLSPKSPGFPHVSLLHAICAYAGVFSYLIEPPPVGDLDRAYPDFIFGDRRRPDFREESFAEMHARWAKEAAEQALAMGFNLFEITQTQVVLAGFYQSQGRQVELWSAIGNVLRYAVPLGLHTSPGFRGDGTKRDPARLSENPESLLPDPTSYSEREVRVNLFWVAYANERFHDSPSSWAMNLDDQDIHQVLPGDLSHFEAGHDIQGSRQSLGSPNVLLQHFPEATDGFSLYIKGAILISKTKWFNLRVRHRYRDVADVRALAEFHQLEQLIVSFKKSFPGRYSSPIAQSSRGLDIHVYAAHIIPHLAMILLHDKHTNLYSPNCTSSSKLLNAARAIVNLMHTVCSTSYDITRLPPICMSCWGRAASVLIRFYKAEIGRGHQGEALTIDLEIQSVKYVLNQMGTRIPMALKHGKLLDFELQTDNASMSYSVSQQGPPDHDGDLHVSPQNSAWMESHSSGSLGGANSFTNNASPLPSLFPDTSPSSLEAHINLPSTSFGSISVNELDILGQSFGGPS